MKKLLFGLLLFNISNLWADTITSGSLGLIKPSTGVVSARPPGDKLNSNFDIIDSSFTQIKNKQQSALTIYDESSPQGNINTLNVTGGGGSISVSGSTGTLNITASGGGGGGSALFLTPNGVTASTITFPLGEFTITHDGVSGATVSYRGSTGAWTSPQVANSSWTFLVPISSVGVQGNIVIVGSASAWGGFFSSGAIVSQSSTMTFLSFSSATGNSIAIGQSSFTAVALRFTKDDFSTPTSSSSATFLLDSKSLASFGWQASPTIRLMSHGDSDISAVYQDTVAYFDHKIRSVSTSFDAHNTLYTFSDTNGRPIWVTNNFKNFWFFPNDSIGANFSANPFGSGSNFFGVGGNFSINSLGLSTFFSSVAVNEVVTSTVGFIAPSSTFTYLNVSGSSIATGNYTMVFPTAPLAGQHLVVAAVNGANAIIAGGGDNAGSGSGTGNDSFGNPVSTRPITAQSGIDASSVTVLSSANIMGVTTSSTGFIAPSSTFNFLNVGDLAIVPSTPVSGGPMLLTIGPDIKTGSTMSVTADGWFGIGVSTPLFKLHIDQQDGLDGPVVTDMNGSLVPRMAYIRSTMTRRPAPVGAGAIPGVDSGFTIEHGNQLTSASGFVINTALNAVFRVLQGDSLVYPIGSIGRGGTYVCDYKGTGSHLLIQSIYANTLKSGSGNVQELTGIDWAATDSAGAGTIFELNGIRLERPVSQAGNTWQRVNGIRIDTMTSAAGTNVNTPAGIVQFGSGDLNYFAGKIKVGISSFPAKAQLDVLCNPTSNYIAVFSTAQGFPQVSISTNGYINAAASTTIHALTSCGTSPTIYGGGSAFTVTPGGGAPGACTVNFSPPFQNPPVVVASPRTGSITNTFSYTVTNTAITVTETGLGVFDVIVLGADQDTIGR